MTTLRPLLWVFTLGLIVTTSLAVRAEGWGFLPAFLGDLTTPGWRAQFNVDFATYLVLSALWIVWREGGSARAWVLAACAGVLGMIVFAPYLLWSAHRADGDLRRLALGTHADPA